VALKSVIGARSVEPWPGRDYGKIRKVHDSGRSIFVA
jgi:hypothetical protein